MSEYNVIDVHGRPITIQQERRSENIFNISMSLCGVFSAFCGAGTVFFVLFMKEWLNASTSTIGLVMSLSTFMPIFGLFGAQIAERLGRRKPFMVTSWIILRLPYVFIALIPLLGQSEQARKFGIWTIIIVVLVSRIALGLSEPIWWSWIGDLVPKERLSRFFGNQMTLLFIVGIILYLTTSFFLDRFGGMGNKNVIITVLSIGALAGTIEALLYLLIPEPKMVRANITRLRDSLTAMIEPFKNTAFRRLMIVIGLYNFFLQLTLPFQNIYLKGAEVGGHRIGLEASYQFLIMLPMIISIVGLLSSKFWGTLGDKLGARMLLLMGIFYWFPFLAYFIASPGNYTVIIIATVAIASFLQPAWSIGMNSAILHLSPQANRAAYGAAYLACNLAMMSPAPYIGGLLADRFALTGWTLPNGMPFSYIHILTLISSVGLLGVIFLMNRIPFTGHRPWKEVFGTLFDRRLLHTLMAMRTLGHSKDAKRLTKALKLLSGTASRMAIKEVLQQLEHTDPDVSREAGRALCRMGTAEEICRLVQESHPGQEDLHKKAEAVMSAQSKNPKDL